MPEKEVEVVRGFYDAVNRWLEAYWEDPGRGIEEAAGFEEIFDRLEPDAEWDWLFSSDVFRGRDQLLQALRDYLETVSEWKIEVRGLVEGTEGRVLAILEVVVRGKGSGTPVRQPIFAVITVSDGKVERLKDYTEQAEGLAAAGVET